MTPARLLDAIRSAGVGSPYRMPERVHDPESDRGGRPRTRMSDSLASLSHARRTDEHAATGQRREDARRDRTVLVVNATLAFIALALVALAFCMVARALQRSTPFGDALAGGAVRAV